MASVTLLCSLHPHFTSQNLSFQVIFLPFHNLDDASKGFFRLFRNILNLMFSGVLESFTSLMSAGSENKTLKKLHIFIIFNKNNLSENSRSSQNLLLDKFHLIVGNYPKLPPRMPTKCQLRAKGSWVSFQTQLRAKS